MIAYVYSASAVSPVCSLARALGQSLVFPCDCNNTRFERSSHTFCYVCGTIASVYNRKSSVDYERYLFVHRSIVSIVCVWPLVRERAHVYVRIADIKPVYCSAKDHIAIVCVCVCVCICV